MKTDKLKSLIEDIGCEIEQMSEISETLGETECLETLELKNKLHGHISNVENLLYKIWEVL